MVSLKKAVGMLIFFFSIGSLIEAQFGGCREYLFPQIDPWENTLFVIGTICVPVKRVLYQIVEQLYSSAKFDLHLI